jgi:hypothetical protein
MRKRPGTQRRTDPPKPWRGAVPAQDANGSPGSRTAYVHRGPGWTFLMCGGRQHLPAMRSSPYRCTSRERSGAYGGESGACPTHWRFSASCELPRITVEAFEDSDRHRKVSGRTGADRIGKRRCVRVFQPRAAETGPQSLSARHFVTIESQREVADARTPPAGAATSVPSESRSVRPCPPVSVNQHNVRHPDRDSRCGSAGASFASNDRPCRPSDRRRWPSLYR